MWLYGSGFPKSLDISKAIDKAKGLEPKVIGRRTDGRYGSKFQDTNNCMGQLNPRKSNTEKIGQITEPATDLAKQWNGWGTALKPAWEPIIIAMKPIDGTFAENAERWGVAGLNVDGGRIETQKNWPQSRRYAAGQMAGGAGNLGGETIDTKTDGLGRWPANLILDEEAAARLDWQTKTLGNAWRPNRDREKPVSAGNLFGGIGNKLGETFNDSGGASRFFYVAKSARAERNEGCDEFTSRPPGGMSGRHDGSMGSITINKNHHPTVKPLSLMKYLCNLTRTPTGGIILDPFAGSGTTLWAAEYHNRPWIGIEMNPEYVAIANARIARERAQIKMEGF